MAPLDLHARRAALNVNPASDWASQPAASLAAWFCLRCQPKHEHIAAAQLAGEADLQVYLPRIRFRRSTRRGPVWFTEALFPGYLFARFDLRVSLRKVHHARAVVGVVHFGNQWPSIPEQAVEQLRASLGPDQVHVLREELQAGEAVQIAGGAFHGLQAVITRLMPGRERVAVLLEFLGRQTMVELPRAQVLSLGDARSRLR